MARETYPTVWDGEKSVSINVAHKALLLMRRIFKEEHRVITQRIGYAVWCVKRRCPPPITYQKLTPEEKLYLKRALRLHKLVKVSDKIHVG